MKQFYYNAVKVLWNKVASQKTTDMLCYEHRSRQQIDIDDMQFGFMKGKGTTDAISL